MAAKLSSLPCFEAFGAIFCPDFVHIFALYVGGGGHSRVSDFWKAGTPETLLLTYSSPILSFSGLWGL